MTGARLLAAGGPIYPSASPQQIRLGAGAGRGPEPQAAISRPWPAPTGGDASRHSTPVPAPDGWWAPGEDHFRELLAGAKEQSVSEL